MRERLLKRWSDRYAGGGPPIATAALLLTLAAVVGKPVTFGRDVVIAREFGATSAVDFVILAQLLPAFLVGIVSTGVVYALPSVFRSVDGGRAGEQLVLALARRILLLETAALAIGGAAMLPILDLVGDERLPFPPLLMGLLCWQALLESAIALHAQTLQLGGRFGRPAVQYALNGLATIAIVVLFAPHIGLWAWPVGLVIDSLWQLAFLRRSLPERGPNCGRLLSHRASALLAAPAVGLAALTLLYSVGDRVAGLLAGAGTLALWTWASRLGSAVTGLASLPLATAVFTQGHRAGAREPRLYGISLVVSAGLSAAAAGASLVIGPWLVDAVFRSRALSGVQIDHLAQLATLALLACVPAALFTVSSRAFMARRSFREPIVTFAAGAVAYPALLAATFPLLDYLSLGVSYLGATTLAGASLTWLAIRKELVSLPMQRRLSLAR